MMSLPVTGKAILPAHLRKATEFIDCNLSEPIKVTTIADSIGASERKLYRSFQVYLNISPIRYVKEKRLAAINKALRHAHSNETVTSIALQFGISQFGRMAAEYKRAFGESPSETLRRSRLKDLAA
jgi:transcriptional regulator GlxA family with amidase domain